MSECLPGIDHAQLVHFLRRYVGKDDAEDVAQTAYLKAHRGRHTFRAESGYKSWVYAIAKRCALDLLRQRRRHPEHESVKAATLVYDYEPRLLHGELRRVQDELRVLSAPLREALSALATHETHREAAASLGLPVTTFKSRAWRARQAVRERLA